MLWTTILFTVPDLLYFEYMKKSLRERIIQYYKKHPNVWISGGELERIAASTTSYKPSTISRRARECAEDGILARKEVKGTVYYCYQPTEKKVERVRIENGRAIVYFETVLA